MVWLMLEIVWLRFVMAWVGRLLVHASAAALARTMIYDRSIDEKSEVQQEDDDVDYQSTTAPY